MKGGITATAECWHALMRFLDSAAVVTSQPAFSMTMTPMRVATCARCRAAMRYWFHPSLQRRRLLLLVLQRTLFSNWRRVRYYCCCCSWTRPSCTHDIINLDTTYTDLTVGCHKNPVLSTYGIHVLSVFGHKHSIRLTVCHLCISLADSRWHTFQTGPALSLCHTVTYSDKFWTTTQADIQLLNTSIMSQKISFFGPGTDLISLLILFLLGATLFKKPNDQFVANFLWIVAVKELWNLSQYLTEL